MPDNPFDKAARYTVRLDPPGFLAWVLGTPADLGYRGWLGTRSVPFPGDPDRTGDTVARLDDPAANQTPWAVAIEFQVEPDPLMFGRLMIYLGNLWLGVKPDPERGSRFHVGAVVVNLTGTGYAACRMDWPATGLTTYLGVVERNLARENADDLLTGIEAGRLSRGLLPWVPLMTGGGDTTILDRWKSAAEAEPDSRSRSEYAVLVTVFAEKTGLDIVWAKALEGWNVTESKVVNGWIAKGEAKGEIKGRAEGLASAVVAVLESRFQSVPADLNAGIRGTTDLATLQAWVPVAATAPTLADFRRDAGV